MATKKTKLPVVKAGQVWIDCDRRREDTREIKVLSLAKNERSKKDPVWLCQVFIGGQNTNRTTKVRQSRFKPGSTGYRLKEATEQNNFKKPSSILERFQNARVVDTQQEDPFKEVDAQAAEQKKLETTAETPVFSVPQTESTPE
jgi:hypothetical protein